MYFLVGRVFGGAKKQIESLLVLKNKLSDTTKNLMAALTAKQMCFVCRESGAKNQIV